MKLAESEALHRADEAGATARAAMQQEAERTCAAIRQQAEQRMDAAVRTIVEKVVKR